MRLTIVQSALAWESAGANRAMFAQKLAPLRGQTDLVVLPEMFTTGFSMNASALAEPSDGPTTRWLHEQAATLGAAVTGSFICAENGRYFNRLVFMRPDGGFEYYDKRHLFALAGEHEQYSAGNKQLVVDWQGWRIRPLVCYDLRFPVWSRNRNIPGAGETPRPTYDLLLYVANWPARRSHHWRALLMARAIENQSFVAGVNIVGKDGNDFEYGGDSAVIDFSGQQIVGISGKEGLFTTELSLEDMEQYRRQLPFLTDGDIFQLS
ncbi:MAG: amidohydrolase [Lewinellaceae bacterium]|nr:amidohydrolase [Lewinellaceae bacterium]